MSTLLQQLYSQNHWLADGVQTVWNFTFADGYLRKAYVKAYYADTLGNKTHLTIVDPTDWTGAFQLTILPAVPAGYTLVIYRDTPKDAPMVNFGDGARVSETSLDETARQAVHICAEVLDGVMSGINTAEFGFRALQQVPYTGASVVNLVDNGRSHFKTDGTSVTVPNTLPTTFLSSITNHSLSSMTVAFDSALAIQQGGADTTGKTSWVLAPKQILNITKIASGVWYISGKAS